MLRFSPLLVLFGMTASASSAADVLRSEHHIFLTFSPWERVSVPEEIEQGRRARECYDCASTPEQAAPAPLFSRNQLRVSISRLFLRHFVTGSFLSQLCAPSTEFILSTVEGLRTCFARNQNSQGMRDEGRGSGGRSLDPFSQEVTEKTELLLKFISVFSVVSC